MAQAIHRIEISALIKKFMSFLTFHHNLKHLFDPARFHSILFAFFLISLPFSIRKVFIVFSPDGSFNEYLDVSLYLSDVLLIATLVVYIISNKTIIKSISYWRKMFHVEHLLLPIFIPALFIFWSGLSIFWSESVPLAAAAFFRLISGYLLYIYILVCNVPRGTSLDNGTQDRISHLGHQKNNAKNVPRGTFMDKLFEFVLQCSTWNILQVTLTIIIISGFFQSVVTILQFLKQKSLGLTLLKESVFTVYDPGVAKIVLNGDVFIRSYGFFPHPNILGGFLVLSLLITMVYPLLFRLKMFHVEHFMGVWFYRILIFTQLLALFFSFSKSAIAGFTIGLIMLVFGIRKMFHVEQLSGNAHGVPRGTFIESHADLSKKCSTWNIFRESIISMSNKLFHVEHLIIVWGIIIIITLLTLINLKFFIVQPFFERLFYMSSINGLFKRYYFEGLGIGQYVYNMQHFFTGKLLLWQLQPIHNVFLLIFSEGGLVGVGLFLWLLVFVFLRNNAGVPRGTFYSSDKKALSSYLFQSVLVVIIVIMFFDHYFWDIQQGQLLLWLILAFSISRKKS